MIPRRQDRERDEEVERQERRVARDRRSQAFDTDVLMPLDGEVSCSIMRTDTQWFAVGFHLAFDYMQLFVIGTPNGARFPVGRLLDARLNGPAGLTGGVLGTEAGSLMYPAIALLWLYVWWR